MLGRISLNINSFLLEKDVLTCIHAKTIKFAIYILDLVRQPINSYLLQSVWWINGAQSYQVRIQIKRDLEASNRPHLTFEWYVTAILFYLEFIFFCFETHSGFQTLLTVDTYFSYFKPFISLWSGQSRYNQKTKFIWWHL